MDDLLLPMIVAGAFACLAMFGLAVADAGRQQSTAWPAGLFLFGAIALIAWLVYGRRTPDTSR